MADITIHYIGPIVTRAEAKAAGLKKYFTGKPCGRGHVCQRYIKSSVCFMCNELRRKTPGNVPKIEKPQPEEIIICYQGQKISREQAKERNLKRYFTGLMCIHGHIAERFTLGGECVECKGYTPEARAIQKRCQQRPENLAKSRERYSKNRELILKKKKDKSESLGKEGRRERYRKKYERNPANFKVNSRNRKAKQKGAEGKYTKNDIDLLFLAQNGVCATPWCGVSVAVRRHIDHKTPLSRGGSNWPTNLQILCPECNIKKRAQTNEEWLARGQE